MLYNIPSAGFISQTLEALVDGLVRSVERAHDSLQPARIYWHQGELLDASINRSPTSYANNPAEERARYQHDTDKQMFLLRFVDRNNQPLAMLNWFAVHGTSMNNTNHLISSDNKGYAALLFEQEFNPPDTLPGKGKFVAIFAQANEGDVSPNTRGPRCIDTGLPCDMATSTCGNPPRNEKCIAFGPGKDMFESTKIIAYKQYYKARQLFVDIQGQKPVRGPIRFAHEHIDITKQQVPLYESVVELSRRQAAGHQQPAGARAARRRESGALGIRSRQIAQQQVVAGPGLAPNSTYQTCVAALGYSFAAGTTDGPGAFDFQQGDTASGRYWNMVRDFLKKPSAEQIRCHHPKPILLSTGEMDFPYMWHPKVVPTQIFMIGQVAIVGLPGEFTTMAGRRVRNAVRTVLARGTPEVRQLNLDEDAHDELDLASDEVRLRASQSGSASNRTWHQQRHPRQASQQAQDVEVVLSGLSNIYTSYITTLEEYDMQRYEGASTLYGPHTLQAYINQFVRLATRVAQAQPPQPDPMQPPNLTKSLFTLKAGVIYDGAPHGKTFGQTLVDVDMSRVYKCREQVSVSFVAGNPRNDLKQEQSFLYVDRFNDSDASWTPIASDGSWETKFIWERTNTLFGESRAVVQWDIPADCQPGAYRIRHYGAHKSLLQTISQYWGKSSPFKVAAAGSTANLDSTSGPNEQELWLDQQLRLALQAEATAPPGAGEPGPTLVSSPRSQPKVESAAGERPASVLSPLHLLSSLLHWRWR